MSKLGISLVLAAVLGAGSRWAGGDMSQARKPDFHHRTETDGESGWKVHILSWQDPKQPQRSVTAKIVPEGGSNLISLQVDGIEILHTPPAIKQSAGVGYGFPILYPTPNRVRDSRFTFQGRKFSFTPNERTHFIHGLVHRASWKTEPPEVSRQGATLHTYLDFDESFPSFPLFPIRHRVRLSFRLATDGVILGFEVENRDQRRLPFGFAFHPYFKILGVRAQTFVRVPAQRHMEAVGLLPTGKLLPLDGSPYDIREFTSLEGLKLDDVYWGMVPGKPAVYECRDRGIRVTLEASEIFTHAVVYTPPGRPYFCIENQTCSTDAHNLHAQGLEKEAHLQVLQLGKSARGTVRVRVSRI